MTAGIYLVSACGSAEEFVAAFRRYADRTGLFVPATSPLPQGRRGRIALTLKDGGVMLEGEAEVVQSSAKSPLHGRAGMMLKFVDLDEPSKTVLAELEKARLAMKPAPSSVPPRPADAAFPSEPRPVVPAIGGRIDAANALAECVVIGDVGALEEVGGGPPKAGPKFVVPSIPAFGGRPKSPTAPPEAPKPEAPKPEAPKPDSTRLTTMGMPAMRPPGEASGPVKKDPTPIPTAAAPKKDPTPIPVASKKDPTPIPVASKKDPTPIPAAPKTDPTLVAAAPSRSTAAFDAEWDAEPAPAAAPAAPAPASKSGPASASKSGPVAAPASAAKSGPVAAPASAAKSGPVAAPASASPSGPSAASTTASKSGPVAAPASAAPSGPSAASTTASKSGPVAAPAAASSSGPVVVPAPVSGTGPTLAASPVAAPAAPAPASSSGPIASAKPDAPKSSAKAAKMTQIGFPVVKPPADSGPKATPLGVVPLRATDAPSGGAPAPTKPPEAVPAPPKLPESTPGASAKPPLPQPTPTRSKSPTAPPRHPTPFAPLPVAKLPAKPAPSLADADVDEKTDLTNVPLEPGSFDSALIESRPPPADPEPPRPVRSGGMRASEIMAAVHADDWTMTPDAPGPTVLPAEKGMPEVPEPTPGPGAPPTGDWTMSLDPAEGWSKPEKVEQTAVAEKPTKIEKRTPVLQTPATGNPVKAVSSDRPIDVQAWEDKPTSIGAKIEIDATLMEPLDPMPAIDEDLPGIAAASSGGMAFPLAGSAPGMPMMAPGAPQGIAPQGAAQQGMAPQGMPPFGSPYDSDVPPQHMPSSTGPETAVAQSLLQPPPLPLPPPPGVPMPQEIPIGYAQTLLPGQIIAPPVPPAPLQYATAQPGDIYRSDALPVTPPRSNKKLLVIVASSLLFVTVVLVLALTLGGKKKHARATQPGKGSGSAVVVMAGSAEGSQTAAVVVPDVHGSDAGSAEGSGSATQQVVTPPTPPTSATCPVEVATTPAGAEVSLDDKQLGTTPSTFQLPCGTVAKLKIQKAKYLGVVRQVTPVAAGTKIVVTLGQGTFSVKLTSTPAGATIKVGGKSMGVTPTAVQLPAFQTVTIMVSKEGYAPDTEKVVIKANGQSHHVTLKKAGRSGGRTPEKSHGLNGI